MILRLFYFLEVFGHPLGPSGMTSVAIKKSGVNDNITVKVGTIIHLTPEEAEFDFWSDEEAFEKVKQLIQSHEIIVFSKSYCPYCQSTKDILKELNVPHTIIEVNEVPNGKLLHQALIYYSKQKTVPNIYIHQTHVGGDSDLKRMRKSGELMTLWKGMDGPS